MNVYNYQLKSNQALNTTFTTVPLQLRNIYGFAIQAVWATGTPNGTFKLQVSADPCVNAATGPLAPAQLNQGPTHWTDLASSSYAIAASGDYVWNVFDTMYNWVRVVYTDSSGGTSTAVLSSLILNAKGI